jgi:hypothetical protein
MDKGLEARRATTVPVSSSSPTTMSEGFGGSRPAAGDTSRTSDNTEYGNEYDRDEYDRNACSLEGSEGADSTPSKRETTRHSQKAKSRVLALIDPLDTAYPASYPDPRPGKPPKPYCMMTGTDISVQYVRLVAHATRANQVS